MPITISRTINDPRIKLLAYVTDGKQLFEVVKAGQGTVTIENCKTGAWFVMTVGHILQTMKLVRAAPSAAPADVRDLEKEKP